LIAVSGDDVRSLTGENDAKTNRQGRGSLLLFRQLEYFVAVARERHFARAAEACYVSQPALSASIAKLERELNVTLINRGHNY
jgi:Bacterial regulatory helix-turn-helix protein, lysR family